MSPQKIEIEEVTCKSALTGSGQDYRLNPYIGCQHACLYCYATYIARWRNKSCPWGSWVQVKTNMPEVLAKELNRKKGIHIMFSTVCDVYQPVEKKFQITHQCLEVLRYFVCQDFLMKIFILTKSNLILRDLDLLKKFPKKSLKIGFTITTPYDKISKQFEPYAPSSSRRFEAAKILKENGFTVGMNISPVLPYFTEREIKTMLDMAKKIKLDSVDFDTLNYANRHGSKKLWPIYNRTGKQAVERLKAAKYDPEYANDLFKTINAIIKKGKYRYCQMN